MLKKSLLVLAVLAIAGLAPAADMATTEHPGIFTPKDVAWGPGPPFLPAGVKIAVLQGDPGKPGPFVIRLSMPNGYQFPAHNHPTTENVTVVSGEFHAGMGDKLDATKGKALPAGSFVSLPAQMNQGLGLGTPANLASLSAAERPRLGRTILTSSVIGLTMVVVVLGLDHLLFSGDSLERIHAIGAMPLALRFG